MVFLYAIFFGAGVASLAYTRIGKRIGYTNNSRVVKMLAVVFILSTIFFYTLLAYVLHV